jgi:hypothetical protein
MRANATPPNATNSNRKMVAPRPDTAIEVPVIAVGQNR